MLMDHRSYIPQQGNTPLVFIYPQQKLKPEHKNTKTQNTKTDFLNFENNSVLTFYGLYQQSFLLSRYAMRAEKSSILNKLQDNTSRRAKSCMLCQKFRFDLLQA